MQKFHYSVKILFAEFFLRNYCKRIKFYILFKLVKLNNLLLCCKALIILKQIFPYNNTNM